MGYLIVSSYFDNDFKTISIDISNYFSDLDWVMSIYGVIKEVTSFISQSMDELEKCLNQ